MTKQKLYITFLITFLSIFLFSNYSYAKSKVGTKNLIFKNREEATAFYYKRIKTAKSDEIIIIPANTLVCRNISDFKKAFRYASGRNGKNLDRYYINTVLSCGSTTFKSYGLVTEVYRKNKIARVLYRATTAKYVSHDYVYMDHVYYKSYEDNLFAD